MKKYKYHYQKPILIAIIACLPLALCCIVVNIVRLVMTFDSYDTYKFVSFAVVIILAFAYIVFAIALLIDSSYVITDKYFIVKWGLLQNKIELKSITRMVLNVKNDKLAVYFNADDYFIVNAKGVDCAEMFDVVRKNNKRAVFEMISVDEKTKNKD